MQCTSSSETIAQENVYYNGVSHHSLGSAGAITLSLPVAHDDGPAMAAVRGSRFTSDTLSIPNRAQQVGSYFFHVDACCVCMLLSRNVQFLYALHTSHVRVMSTVKQGSNTSTFMCPTL